MSEMEGACFMKFFRQVAYVAVAVLLLIVPGGSAQAKSTETVERAAVDVIVKGKLLERGGKGDSFSAGFIKNNRTYIPVRSVSETLGYEVNYTEKDKKIDITKGNRHIAMQIGSRCLVKGNTSFDMDVAPLLVDGTSYLPARYLVEAMEETVHWDGANRVVLLSTPSFDDSAKGSVKEFVVGDYRFTLCFPKEFEERILVKQGKEGGSVEFYDRYNHDSSNENHPSGHLYSLLVSKRPSVIDAPGIVFSYKDGNYLNAAMEGGVEYNSKDKESTDQYKKSMEQVEAVFTTYKERK